MRRVALALSIVVTSTALWSAPATAIPATTTPGTALPATTTPGTAASGTATPGTATPGTATPGTATPGTATPGTATPGTALPATTALVAAPAATIQILSTTLVAKGAAVDISYAVDCPAGYSGSTALDVTQPQAHGTATDELTCTGTGLLYLQRVTADITDAPFARGKATLTMQAMACSGADCISTPYQATVKITR
jgi:hypothetical protein